MSRRVERWKRDYILSHPGESRFAMARKLGVGVATVYRVLQEAGESTWSEGYHVSGELLEAVRARYATTGNRELAAELGVKKHTVAYVAHKLGLRKDPSFRRGQRAESLTSHRRERADWRERLSRKMRAVFKAERLRLLSGQPQETAYRLSALPRKAARSKARLVRVYGYFPVEGDPYTLCYDRETRRMSPRQERWFSERRGFDFLPADDFGDERDTPREET